MECATVRALLQVLYEISQEFFPHMTPDTVQDFAIRGVEQHWLEIEDYQHISEAMERRQCARILHDCMRRYFQVKDLEDISLANQLLDLYDCRACVNHVAQVYCRHMMKGITPKVFGMKAAVLEEELEDVKGKIIQILMEQDSIG